MRIKGSRGSSGRKRMKERTSGGDRGMVTPGYDHMTTTNAAAAVDAALGGLSASQPIVPPNDSQFHHDQAQFESDKRAVYKHPLFPLLALLFEKCEIATQTSPESAMSDSFHQDLEAFVQHQERDRKPFLANDPEVDGLMIKAIQVLRIHLLELDKVQELCKDFCTRYITCLKGKMQSENLLRSDYYDNGSGPGGVGSVSLGGLSPSGGGVGSVGPVVSPGGSCYSSSNGGGDPSVSPLYHGIGGSHHQAHSHHAGHFLQNSTSSSHNHHHQSSGPSSASSAPVPALLNPSPDPNSSSTGSSHHSSGSPSGLGIHGGTPLSQIGANSNPCPTTSSSHDTFVQRPTTPSSAEEEEDYLGRKKPKRGVLPKHATSIMRSWLFQHIVHPYPTEDEKRQIAAQTNLTLLQVNNWFINARRRILQPMLDASNPEPATPKQIKKMKTNGSKPALKYWSDNLATMGSGNESGNGLSHHIGDESSDESEESSNDGHDLLIDNSDSSQQ